MLARYASANPNGSAADIAGIVNEAGNVVGLMPHPEHAIDPLTGPRRDGLGFFTSVLRRAGGRVSTAWAAARTPSRGPRPRRTGRSPTPSSA